MAFPGRVEGFSPWFKLVVREPEGDITLGRFLSIMLERHGVEVIGLACAAAERAGVLKPLFMSGSARAARRAPGGCPPPGSGGRWSRG